MLLRTTLQGHTQDVKGLASRGLSIVSASRDGQAIVWTEEPDGSYSPRVAYKADSFLNSCTVFAEPPQIAVGEKSGVILVVDLNVEAAQLTPAGVLVAHQSNVCALSSKGSRLISGSWDNKAVVWDDGAPIYVLEGHKAAVWDAQIVNDDTFITCLADRSIKVWRGATCVRTLNVHLDVVRSLAVLSESLFYSCSNDGTIKLVTTEGAVLKTLEGHLSFVYQARLSNDGTRLFSCGEDRCVKIWDVALGKCLETITLPCVSVWSVCELENGDLAVGGSDLVVRIFTSSKSRADLVADANLKEQVEKAGLDMQQVDTSKVSGPEALTRPGKEGQTIMVKNNVGVVEAFTWANNTWQKIGEVMGVASSQKKTEYNGKEYDFVFDVDVKEGAPPLKLPYNASDNPYTVAEKFLADNDLPTLYVQQVVEFITKNTQGVQLTVEDSASPQKKYTTFESFKKALLMKGLEMYNDKAPLESKFSQGELKEIETLLDSVDQPAAQKVYEMIGRVIESGEIVGYDILRIIISKLEYNEDLGRELLRGMAVTDKTDISNADASKFVMVGRCVCNLLANEANRAQFPKATIDMSRLRVFYRVRVAPNSAVKDSVKTKVKETLDGLENNL